jgi:hypothetical protein
MLEMEEKTDNLLTTFAYLSICSLFYVSRLEISDAVQCIYCTIHVINL